MLATLVWRYILDLKSLVHLFRQGRVGLNKRQRSGCVTDKYHGNSQG